MAEKKVSVRLAAVGGRQVRAELEGIGDAGKRGFGKASREMEIANARLAKFARRAKIAAGIMAAAAVSASVAMVRSGLQVIDEQAKLAASLGTTTESLQVLARAADLAGVSQGEVEQATIMMTKSLSQAAQGTGPAVKALEQLHLSATDLAKLPIDEKLTKIQDAIQQYIPAAQRAAVASQIFGARAGLIFSRIDSATLRQATKDVQDFGVAVSEQDAAQIQRTNDALSRMGLLWRGIANQLAVAAAPALEAVADAFATVAKTTGPLGRAIKGLFNHIGELATIAATFAGIFGVRLVASLTAAALGVGKLALSMKVLRAAIIRTGIGALIVGAGELIYWFGRLVNGVGGFGEALRLMKNVAVEVWERVKTGAKSLGLSLASVWTTIQTGWLRMLARIQKGWADFLHKVAGGLRDVPGMDKVALKLGGAAIDAGSAYYEMAAAAEAARGKVDRLAASSREAANAAIAPLKSVEALRNALKTAGNDGAEALARTNSAVGEVTTSVARAGGAARKAAEVAKSAWETATNALKDYATRAMDLGKGLGDSLAGAFSSAEQAIGEFVRTGKLDFRSMVTSMLADMAKLSARRFILGPMANALSGALGNLGGMFAPVMHEGGLVGAGGPTRAVPALAFAGAPRMHAGGWVGLRPDEVPAILQRGERVLSRREVAADAGGAQNITINIQTRDAESFRQSRAQVAADIARAVALGRRGM
jgi:Lambda phage tail tape-measure protein (Tape_meas_lam_C).